MFRKRAESLREWKNQGDRKPLVIRGARQVGKTYLVREFAAAEFQYFIEINFDETPSKRELFALEDIESVVQYLSLDADVPIIPGETLLFLDEIQQAPEILARLRYFYEKKPDLHVIAAGSLLDIVLADHTFSMPVGRIQYMHMGPLDFMEFLRAIGATALHGFIQTWTPDRPIPRTIHETLMEQVRLFMSVGGMPSVVRSYVESGSLRPCDRELGAIAQTFREDFAKYGSRVDVDLLRRLLDTTSAFVGRKVKYSEIDRTRPAELVRTSLVQLERAQLLYRVFHSSGNGIPLRAEQKERSYKLLHLDSGLMMHAMGAGPLNLAGKDPAAAFRGALAEQFVGRQWLDGQEWYQTPELHYWNREKAGTTSEVDYLVQIEGAIVPIEVKSGTTGSLKSLHVFAAEKQIPLAVRFNSDPPRVDRVTSRVPRIPEHTFTLLSLPLYLAPELRRLVSAQSRNTYTSQLS